MIFGRFGFSMKFGAGKGSSGPALPAQTMSLGIYPFNDNGQPYNTTSFETWLGAGIDSVVMFINGGTWSSFRSNADNCAVQPFAAKQVLWTVALAQSGTTLAQVAAGSNDADFTYAANAILSNATAVGGNINIRLGWEFNLTTNAWASHGVETDYIAAFRRVVGLFRALSPRFRFHWCPYLTLSTTIYDPTTSYPGDDVVDVIAGDCYFNSTYDGSDPNAAFGFKQTSANGLDALVAMAASHSKPWGISEWGVTSDVYAPCITQLASYMRAHGCTYHNYWDSAAGITPSSRLSNNQYTNAAAAYIAAFGTPAITSAAATSIDSGSALSQTLTANQPVTWQITGGADKQQFSLSGTMPSTSATLSMAAKNQAAPVDANLDNVYNVQLRAVSDRQKIATQNFAATVVPAYVFTNAEAQAYVARMSAQPSSTRKAQIDTFIGSLKSAGVYALLDTFYVLASHNATAALLNVLGATNTAAPVGTPTFAIDRGYTGNYGTGSYVTLNRPGNAAGGKYTTNAASASVWELTNVTSNNGSMGGTVAINTHDASGNVDININDWTSLVIASNSGPGLYTANRTASNARQAYKNGAQIGADTQAADNAPGSASFIVCAGNPSYPESRQIAIAATGGSLTAPQALAFYNACQTYLHAIGAV